VVIQTSTSLIILQTLVILVFQLKSNSGKFFKSKSKFRFLTSNRGAVVNIDITITLPNGTILSSNSNSNFEVIEFEAITGNYTIKITSVGIASTFGSYNLNISTINSMCIYDAYEPNNYYLYAKLISFSQFISAQSCSDEDNYYLYDTEARSWNLYAELNWNPAVSFPRRKFY
jgi:hypothetical protein